MTTIRREFIPAIKACLENGQRILDDAEFLEYSKPPGTALALAVIAQEELAKAFLLHLVAVGAVPWSAEVRRATRDHRCKHLLGLVMDFLNPDTDGFHARLQAIRNGEPFFPPEVADAIDIFRHEKIARWKSTMWVWAEEPIYDTKALNVAEGRLDQEKQDALYVRIGRGGRVAASPESVTAERVRQELERGRRFARLVEGVLQRDVTFSIDYEEITATFAAVFGGAREEETNTE